MEYKQYEFSHDTATYLLNLQKEGQSSLSEFATQSNAAQRLFPRKNCDLLRGDFAIDIDKILHNALYNRYIDKTQVFSLYKNDDITRRSTHVQMVSRIARTIGQALRLNLDLIEAIAIGHDIGHTPFGHIGEKFLSTFYKKSLGKHFNHNVHSVRILKTITQSNLTLQTLDGILCHNGEMESMVYAPGNLNNFDEFNQNFERCYTDKEFMDSLRPCTLEGCVVKISDMIAYIWKDRQDAMKLGLDISLSDFTETDLGNSNIEFLNILIGNIVDRSYNKGYIQMDENIFKALETLKRDNYKCIYKNKAVARCYDAIEPMMGNIFSQFCEDVASSNEASPIFTHFLNSKILGRSYKDEEGALIPAPPEDIAVDFIASMTDDYFIDLHRHMFPDDKLNDQVSYQNYF